MWEIVSDFVAFLENLNFNNFTSGTHFKPFFSSFKLRH